MDEKVKGDGFKIFVSKKRKTTKFLPGENREESGHPTARIMMACLTPIVETLLLVLIQTKNVLIYILCVVQAVDFDWHGQSDGRHYSKCVKNGNLFF